METVTIPIPIVVQLLFQVQSVPSPAEIIVQAVPVATAIPPKRVCPPEDKPARLTGGSDFQTKRKQAPRDGHIPVDQAKAEILRLLENEEALTIGAACQKIGYVEQSVWAWRKEDCVFDERFKAVQAARRERHKAGE